MSPTSLARFEFWNSELTLTFNFYIVPVFFRVIHYFCTMTVCTTDQLTIHLIWLISSEFHLKLHYIHGRNGKHVDDHPELSCRMRTAVICRYILHMDRRCSVMKRRRRPSNHYSCYINVHYAKHTIHRHT